MGQGEQIRRGWLLRGLALLALAPLAVFANTTLTINVASGATQTYTAQLGAGIDILKTGPGKLIVSNDNNTAFAGIVTVRGGILEAQSGLLKEHRVFGSLASNTIIVEKGAQLITRVPGPAGQGDKQFPNNLILAGSGPDGTGALRAYRWTGKSGSGGNIDALFANVSLSDDAVVRAEVRTGFSKGTVCLNGHRLDLYRGSGSNFMIYDGSTWSAGSSSAQLVVTNSMQAITQGTVTFTGDGTLVVAPGATLSHWGTSLTCPWRVRFDGTGTMSVGAGTTDKANNIAGPIEMKGNVSYTTYSSTKGMRQHLGGAISGAGKLTKAGIHTLHLDNAANAWTGGTLVNGTADDSQSILVAKYPGSLPGWDSSGSISISTNAALAVNASNWTATQAKTLTANLAPSVGTIAYCSFAPWTDGTSATWNGNWFSTRMRLCHLDTGTFTTDTSFQFNSKLRTTAGTLVLTGNKSRTVNELNVWGGTLVLDGGQMVSTKASAVRIGRTSAANDARLLLRNGAVLDALNKSVSLTTMPDTAIPEFAMGSTGGKAAVLELDGGTFTGRVIGVSGAQSVIRIKDGEFIQMSGPSSDAYFARGAGGYAYVDQTGGKFTVRAHTGMMASGGACVYEMKGGSFSYLPNNAGSCNFTLSRGYGYGEFHQTGGLFDTVSNQSAGAGQKFRMGIQDWSDATGGVAVATLAGTGAVMRVRTFDMGLRLTNFVSVLNLNAGVLETEKIAHDAWTRVNSPGYVNFGGGTLRAVADTTDPFGTSGSACARVTLFGDGAVFDTAGHLVKLTSVPLSGPSGKGVVALTIPSTASRIGYAGPPEVVISGNGAGATAHCAFDPATGLIGPIEVTSPGWGYTSATAQIRTADRTGWVTLTATLGTPEAGGFTKVGAGTLELACANSYGGTAILKEGTVKTSVAGALPAASGLIFAGGALNTAAGPVTVAYVGGVGDISSHAVTATRGLVVDAVDLIAGRVLQIGTGTALSLPSTLDVRILHAELLENEPGPFTIATFGEGAFECGALEGTGARLWGVVGTPMENEIRLVRKASMDLDVSRPRIGEPLEVAFGVDGVHTGTETATWYRSSSTTYAFGSTPHATGLSYTPTAADCEHWFRVVGSDAEGTRFEKEFFFSRLPVCYIDVANGAVPSTKKEEHDATIRIQGNAQYPFQYEGATTIKVRGNSTKGYAKKPWKIKLAKKTDVFGLGGGTKNKHWVLLANYLDECLMRNTLGSRLGDELGTMGMKTEWVDVILNGAYNGCYQFSQQIRVGEERVDIYDWSNAGSKIAENLFEDLGAALGYTEEDQDAIEDALEADMSWMTTGQFVYRGTTFTVSATEKSKLVGDQATVKWKKFTTDVAGGYLFEFSNEYDELSKFTTMSGALAMKTMINMPENLYTCPEAMAWCQDYLQRYWDACVAPNGYNSSGEHWSELAAIGDMTGYWLTMVITGNSDSSYKSRYAYIDHGKKMHFGPVWDFDWGCGGPVLLSEDGNGGWKIYSGTNSWNVATSSGSGAGFYREWCDDPWFCLRLWEKYWRHHAYLESIAADGGLIDQWAEHLAEAGAANEAKWRYRVGFSGPNGDVARFKRYMKDRLDWLDKKFANVDTLMTSLKTSSASPYTRSTSLVPTFTGPALRTATNSVETVIVDKMNPNNRSFMIDVAAPGGVSVELYVNGLIAGTCAITNGAAHFTVPTSRLTAEIGRRNCFSFISRDAGGAVLKRTYGFVLANEPVRDGLHFQLR